MVSAAIANGVRRFVMCSSMARYGTNQVPFTEDMTPKPQDPYGIGKYTAELMLRNLAETHGMEWVIAVPHNIVGPRQKYDDPYRNVASIFINLMLQGRQPYIYGTATRSAASASSPTTSRRLKQMAFDPACVGEIINIGPDDEFVTINELAEGVAGCSSSRWRSPTRAAPAGGLTGQLLGRQGAQAARLQAQGEARGRASSR